MLVLLPLTILAQKKPGEAASLDKVEIQGVVKPGGAFSAVVHVKLDQGYHTHSNQPSEPNFIATVLKVEAKNGVKVGAIKYPEGKSEKVKGLEKPLSIYEDHFAITVPITLEDKARLPVSIPATLTYQACQGATCYPPKKLSFDILVMAGAKKQ
jgi:DsbC/DsbD-like thiol-disulfide interchange protein